MSTDTLTPYRSGTQASARDGFVHLLRAEWTKFRTVRGWLAGMLAAVLVVVSLGVMYAAGSQSSCDVGPVEAACPPPPVGPDGAEVTDRFTFLHQPLAGDGSVTARLTSMTGIITYPPPDHDEIVPGLVPWAKAGIIVKESTRPGSAYAAMLLSGKHGVRMQYDFTHDTAGRPGGVSARAPRWLRLTRSGDTLTGYESADGRRWTKVGAAHLAGLPATVQVGLFVNSPGDLTVKSNPLGGSISQARFTQASAVFDHVSVRGAASVVTSGGSWREAQVGDDPSQMTDWERFHNPNGVERSGDTFTVSGTGDMAPSGEGPRVENTLTGIVAGLILVVVVAVLFVTAEYRRGLIRTTLLASPRRGRVLVAKGLVIGAATFGCGLVAAGVTVPVATHLLLSTGNHVLPVSSLTQWRVIVGAAALLAVAAVLALGLGALVRRAVAAVAAAIVLVVVPYLLATASVLPDGVTEWLMRLTPAAGFAITQSIPAYAHVIGHYAPSDGYYPLAPWAGLAVMAGWAAIALGLAILALRRRDA